MIIKDIYGKDVFNGERSDLSGANLSYANLRRADLIRADLSGANLRGADLSRASLSGANLSEANLSGASLRGADLSRASLRGANLREANLREANLSYANLRGADLSEAQYNECTAFFALACPEKGSFTAYKKLRNGIVAELRIPKKAKRSSATSRKCRASEAKVVALYKDDKEILGDILGFTSSRGGVYKKGETTYPDSWDEDRWNECSNGIHFFITMQEAINYGV